MKKKQYRHNQWCWSDSMGNSVLVSELSEKQAKDALCQCIEVIEILGALTSQSAEVIENAGFVRP